MPDGYSGVVPSLEVLPTGQSWYWWNESQEVAAGAYSEGTILTVPTGYIFRILGVIISAPISGITRFSMAANSGTLFDFWYDLKGEPLFIKGSMDIAAGYAVKRRIYNYLPSTQTFQFHLAAIQVKI